MNFPSRRGWAAKNAFEMLCVISLNNWQGFIESQSDEKTGKFTKWIRIDLVEL